jgi:hypothetical protein
MPLKDIKVICKPCIVLYCGIFNLLIHFANQEIQKLFHDLSMISTAITHVTNGCAKATKFEKTLL